MAQPLPLPLSTPTLSSFEEPIDDYITDIKYDFYGRRTVTTWAHGLVRIRDIDESGKWVVSEGCELKATHAVSSATSSPAARLLPGPKYINVLLSLQKVVGII